MSEPDSITKPYPHSTSTIPTELLTAFEALFRAAEAEVDHAMTWSCHEEDRMVDLMECVKEVIRLGGGK